MPNAQRYDVHVISHTHWDREWYLPLGRFRQRLVALIDELLDLGEGAPRFLLDGQAIVLEDYLAVRPDRAAELGAALRAGRLEAGPWYVLADEQIPSGEALVRNLFAGRRVLRALRATPPRVLYCPDSFGHPAALPLVAAEFGFRVVIVWRGYGGRRWPPGDAARWRHAGGSEVVLYHLPRSGYEFGANLPSDPSEAQRRWKAMREELATRARLGVLLVQNGADHHALQTHRDEAVRTLAQVASPDRVVGSSLAEFARDVEERSRATQLPVVHGELRDSYGYAWVLQGTFGTRAHEKRRNACVERTLAREAEPWCALARLAGGSSRRHLVEAAWRTLLQCHPHDTLCGCSLDAVARAMESRLEEADAQARGIRDDALHDLVGHGAAHARTQVEAWRPVLVVRNPAARPRGGVAEVSITVPVRHVPVGPGSGGAVRDAARTRTSSAGLALDGGAILLQVLSRRLADARVESPRHYPRNELVERISALAIVPDVAGYGTRSFSLDGRATTAASLDAPVVATGTTIDNGLLRLEPGADGVRLIEHASGRIIERLLALEDIGDRGDLYTHSRGRAPDESPALESIRVVHDGPLRGTLAVRYRVPVRSANDRRTRESRAGAVVVARVSLDARSPLVRIAVRGHNRAPDHRLRLRIGTDVSRGETWADAAFAPVHREPLEVPAEEAAIERPPRTAPMHRYVTRAGADRGATVFGDGLAEYEACTDGAVAITLVRAVGALSRNDLPERPGHAGWPTPTPGAQSFGPFAGRFALLLHGARDGSTIDRVERAADDFLLPLTGRTLRAALSHPEPTRGLELRGPGLAFSAAKDSEDGEWLVLRCVNLLDTDVEGEWRVDFPAREARLSRLDETPLGDLAIDDGHVPFRAAPRATITVLVR